MCYPNIVKYDSYGPILGHKDFQEFWRKSKIHAVLRIIRRNQSHECVDYREQDISKKFDFIDDFFGHQIHHGEMLVVGNSLRTVIGP